MKYQKYLWKPKNWNILKTASKNEHYCQIASRAFPHEKTQKNFACGGLTRTLLVLGEIFSMIYKTLTLLQACIGHTSQEVPFRGTSSSLADLTPKSYWLAPWLKPLITLSTTNLVYH